MKEYVHPYRLFTFHYPEGWEVEEEEEGWQLALFRAPSPVGRINVTMLLVKEEKLTSQGGAEALLEAMLKAVKKTMAAYAREFPLEGKEAPSEGERFRFTLNGAEAVACEYAEAGMHWRLWALRRGGLGVIVTYRCPEEEIMTERADVDSIVASITLNEPPLDATSFTELVRRKCLEQCPDMEIKVLRDLVLQIGPGTLHLRNLYRSCLFAPERQEELIEEFLQQVLRVYTRSEEVISRIVGPWETVREHVLPMLKTEEHLKAWGMNQAVYRLWTPPLIITYVVDEGGFVEFIMQDWLERWGIGVEELHTVAMQNLVKQKGDFMLQGIGASEEEFWAIAVAEGDSYDATRLLLPDFHQRLAPYLGQRFLVAVPNRDFLIAFREDNPEIVRRFVEQVRQDARLQPYPLTDCIFRCTAEGLEVFSLPTF